MKNPPSRSGAGRRAALRGAAAVAAVACSAASVAADRAVPPCIAGPDPFEVRLVPTAHANGATGIARLTFAESPFVVAVTPDGHHRYDAAVAITGLGARAETLVVWAATPELDRVQKLGVLAADGTLSGARITFNKFLVFVTAEPNPDVERWTGPILLRGISPSGRLHTMAGHGPFQGESCGGVFGPQW